MRYLITYKDNGHVVTQTIAHDQDGAKRECAAVGWYLSETEWSVLKDQTNGITGYEDYRRTGQSYEIEVGDFIIAKEI